MSERLFGRLLSLPKPGLRPGLAAGTAAKSGPTLGPDGSRRMRLPKSRPPLPAKTFPALTPTHPPLP